jgi:hypothetical protein
MLLSNSTFTSTVSVRHYGLLVRNGFQTFESRHLASVKRTIFSDTSSIFLTRVFIGLHSLTVEVLPPYELAPRHSAQYVSSSISSLHASAQLSQLMSHLRHDFRIKNFASASGTQDNQVSSVSLIRVSFQTIIITIFVQDTPLCCRI